MKVPNTNSNSVDGIIHLWCVLERSLRYQLSILFEGNHRFEKKKSESTYLLNFFNLKTLLIIDR